MISPSSIPNGLKNALFPRGKPAAIRSGLLAGFRYTVSANSGWSPIFGRWEPGAHQVYARVIKPGQVAYDLGANSGLHSMLFSKLTGPNGHVYSFEPLPSNIAEIRSNLALNGLENVTIVEKAVSSESGSATFTLGEHDKQGSLVGMNEPGAGSVVVSVTTLDAFIVSARAPNFIKVDIEGAEGPALQGALTALKQHKPILSIELHSPQQDVLVGATLDGIGYKLYRFDPASRIVPAMEPIVNPNQGWPNPKGIWGTILGVPPNLTDLLSQAKFDLVPSRG